MRTDESRESIPRCRIILAVFLSQDAELQTVGRKTISLKYWDFKQTYQDLYTSKTHTDPEAGFATRIHKETE